MEKSPRGLAEPKKGGVMHSRRTYLVSTFCGLLLLTLVNTAWAVYLDGARTLEFTGKAQTRLSIRLQDSEGFTAPPNISVGNLVQWRNIAYLEINHDLEKLQGELGHLEAPGVARIADQVPPGGPVHV